MTKIKIYLSFTFLFAFVVACGTNYGNKLESEELDVYFTQIENENIAREVALYWKENQMLGSKKQYLQLDEKDSLFLLKIIPTETFDPQSFSFDERALLKNLQDSLQFLVAPKRLEIVIAKSNFETLYNIN